MIYFMEVRTDNDHNILTESSMTITVIASSR